MLFKSLPLLWREYYINDSVITPTESVKDLGIIDPSLKFHNNVSREPWSHGGFNT